MRYVLFVFLSLCLMATSFWGCEKEDLGNLDSIFSDTTQAGTVSQMSARIDDVAWSANSYDITLTPGNPGQIVINGESADGQMIGLAVANSKQGDFLMSKLTGTVATYSPDSTGATEYKSNALATTGGVVSIDSIDTVKQVMTGTFNFVGGLTSGTTKNITDGMFVNIGYTNASKNVNFSANVNGNTWNPANVAAVLDPSNNVLTITAINANGQKMVLNFPGNVKVAKVAYTLTASGTYSVAFYDAGYTLVPDATSTYNTKPAVACSMHITANNTTTTPRSVSGTFSFYAVNSADLTQKGSRITTGVFNLSY